MVRNLFRVTVLLAAPLALTLCLAACGSDTDDPVTGATSSAAAAASSATADGAGVRIATYNASLNRTEPGQLLTDLATPDNAQAKVIAEIIQRNHPEVLLINEFDYYANNEAVDLFSKNYLGVGQNGQAPVEYPYAYAPPVNTGVPSGVDLDGDGRIDGNDAFGFGNFPGQYGFVVYSKYPIDTANVRTFQDFLWKDMPGNLIPRDYYKDNADLLRLSSKNHADIPIDVDGTRVHVLASHPTPPSFDGGEDRNGKRNHDEIRLWADYIKGGADAGYLRDDKGVVGGLAAGENFVVMGDLNSDPLDGDSVPGTTDQLLSLSQLQDPKPTSNGAAAAGNTGHLTPPEYDTADFSDPTPGNIRVDYVLPSTGLQVLASQVFWPAPDEPGGDLMDPKVSSDHRLVWLDLDL